MLINRYFYLVVCVIFSSVLLAQNNSMVYQFGVDDLSKDKKGLLQVGTRTNGYLKEESLVPVDIISAEELELTGQAELSQALTYLVPSFTANHQTIADGTDHITPASLRGLGPDQMLILINGKRMHASALVNVNGTFGRGTVSSDLDMLPLAAIKQIEILRDGASAQYGSDAIAGVINIVLKDKLGVEGSMLYSKTTAGDGARSRINTNLGVKIGALGYLNITGEFVQRDRTNRAGAYTGTIYNNDSQQDQAHPMYNSFDRNVMNIGNAKADVGKTFFNLSIPLRKRAEIYAFGGITNKKSWATGFYRFPKDEEKVVLEIHPNGFLPEIEAPINDRQFTVGLRQTYNKWNIDFASSYGQNHFDFKLLNSNNASMGEDSPTSFYCGGYSYSHLTVNIDLARTFRNIPGVQRLSMAMGGEFTRGAYAIMAGDESSYIDGGRLTSSGEKRLPGSQLFSGFRSQNELEESRTSNSVYLDFEMDVNKRLKVDIAGTLVNYSDWGGKLSGRLAFRYKLLSSLYVRSSVGTGFRAPSLHQSYLTNVSTQILGGESYQVGTFNRNSKVTKALGIPPLNAEQAFSHTAGLLIKPLPNLTIIADYYLINIYDRIVLSGRFDTETSAAVKAELEPFGVNSAQFFTNAIDTRSIGADIELRYQHTFSPETKLRLSAAYNVSHNKIVGGINAVGLLAGNEEVLFNREERARIESAVPASKFIGNALLQYKRFSFNLRNYRFGEVSYVHPTNPDQDQEFGAKWLTDASISYAITQKIKLTVGGINLFDVYPDAHTHPDNTNSGQFIYSRRVTQFGFNGASYFGRLNIML